MALHRKALSSAADLQPAPTSAPQAAPAPQRLLLYHVISSLFSILVVGALMFYIQRPDPPAIVLQPPPTLAPSATPPPTATPGPITVYVSGAVARSALYSLAPGSRVGDAIMLAGGLLPEANGSRINQAEFLSDGDQVFVPLTVAADPASTGAVDAPALSNSSLTVGALLRNSSPSDTLINLNSASLEELMLLPGIGQTKAENIMAGRPYATVEELERVSGIGAATVEKLREYITVE